jgi:hypothetical protein
MIRSRFSRTLSKVWRTASRAGARRNPGVAKAGNSSQAREVSVEEPRCHPNQPATTATQEPAGSKPAPPANGPSRSSLDRVVEQLERAANRSGGTTAVEGPAKPSVQDGIMLSMKKALQSALDATRAAEQYAEEIGFVDRNGDPFRFSHLDIRAIGLSMFIEIRRRAW